MEGRGMRIGCEERIWKGLSKCLGAMDVFKILIMVMVSWAHIYVTTLEVR